MSSDKFLQRDASPEEMSWALIDFAAWCFESKGNLASTISGKIAAVQYYDRVEAQVEIIATSPLIRCALKGIARSHVEAGTRHRVRLPVTYVENVVRRRKLHSGVGNRGKSHVVVSEPQLFLDRPIR